jgi:hypothetical protein
MIATNAEHAWIKDGGSGGRERHAGELTGFIRMPTDLSPVGANLEKFLGIKKMIYPKKAPRRSLAV